MKTYQFKLVRAFCALMIIATILGNMVYLGIFVWKYKVFDIERSLLFEKSWTLRSFSLYLIYLNIFVSFSYGYSFNIASKYMLKVVNWISVLINGFGAFACGYLKLYGHDAMQLSLQTNMFSYGTSGSNIFERYPGQTNIIDIKILYLNEYEALIKNFIVFEVCSIVAVLAMTLSGLSVRFLKIHRDEEKIPEIISEVVGNEEIISLRPVTTLVSMRV